MNFEVKDLTGLGAPITKLIEVVSAGIGTTYRPRAIRKEAEAKAYAAQLQNRTDTDAAAEKIFALALADAAAKMAITDLDVVNRAKARLFHREIQRQTNIEAIAEAAVKQLPNEVSPEAVNEDWRTRFFNIAEDVSNSDMQQLWGKILAGEVSQPGSFSIRTLEIMRNITQTEALMFQRARYLALDYGHILQTGHDAAMPEFGLTLDNLLRLREAGLVVNSETLTVHISMHSQKGYTILSYNGQGLLFVPTNNAKSFEFQQIMLSSGGVELLRLIEPSPQIDYLNKLADWAMTKQCSMSLGIPGAPVETFKKLGTKPLPT